MGIVQAESARNIVFFKIKGSLSDYHKLYMRNIACSKAYTHYCTQLCGILSS